jgi:hypothetical protein
MNRVFQAQDMAHPLEATIRQAYAAFGRGDVEGYVRCSTEDFIFTIPGRGALSGCYNGWEGLHQLARKVAEITGGTFREEVEHVLANDRHAFVLARHRFLRDAQPREYQTLHAYEVRNGRLARCWEHPCDQAAFDDAWGPPG